jgi:recombination protein RecA
MSDDLSGRERALAEIRKALPNSFIDSEEDYGVLTTGSLAADFVTVRGGFPRARVTEVSGFEASGKTSLVQSAIARAQRAGLYPAYLDPEQALDRTFAAQLGVNLDQTYGLFIQPTTFEETAKTVESLIEHDAADLIAVDSVSAMIPESVFDGDVGGVEAIGLRARHMSAWVPRLIQAARMSKRKPAIVLINQLRQVIPRTPWEMRFGAKTQTTGGVAIRFYSSLRLEMSLRKKGYLTRKADDPFLPGKEIEIPVANEHRVECTKNKVGKAHLDAPLWVRYDDKIGFWGVDNVKTLLNMAAAKGHVEIGGKGRYRIGEKSLHGEDSAFDYLFGQPEECLRLANLLGIANWETNYAPLGWGSNALQR